MFELTAANLTSLVTLTAMETVLGIDNIIFIAILVGRLPLAAQNKTRNIGIGLALIIRVILLFSISWIMTLTQPLFTLLEQSFSGRDLILLVGNLFSCISILGKLLNGCPRKRICYRYCL